MTDYRSKLYSEYCTTHTENLYGDVSIKSMRTQFVYLKYYFCEFLPEDKQAKILDIGFGTGGVVYWLQQTDYKNTFGIDISAEQVEKANNLGIANISIGDFREYLKDINNYYDVIFAKDVLEHYRKDEIIDTLNIVFKALNKGGVFILQTPNGDSPFSGRYRYGDFTHETAFTSSSLHQILTSTGFNQIKFKQAGPVPHGFISIIRLILWTIVTYLLKLYLLIEVGVTSRIFTQNIIVSATK